MPAVINRYSLKCAFLDTGRHIRYEINAGNSVMMIKPKVVSISSNRKLRTVQISKPKVIITKLVKKYALAFP